MYVFNEKQEKLPLELQPLFATVNQASSYKFPHGIWSYTWFIKECEKYGIANSCDKEWIQYIASHHGD